MKNFRTYTLAVEFYRSTKTLPMPYHLKEQLNRASSSIALNLAEGSARRTKVDQRRFFNIAFSSLRESQAILDLMDNCPAQVRELSDKLAAHIYKLLQFVTRAA
ncbi:MAG: four helix bundle protein [Proteobacteria bacterium]|nr:four helix bundle protein [Pseudomonadota bacterium]